MRFLRSKKGIGIVVLIVLVLLGVGQSGVLGDTRIGITLKTNQNLNNGLVAHYSFDGDFETGTFEFGTGGVTTTDPTSGSDIVYGIASDDEGYMYFTGECTGCDDGSDSYYTYKVNPADGSLLWATSTDPTTSQDIPDDIVVGPDGFVYVTGYCNFGCGSFGNFAHYTIKIDPTDGSMIWATTTDPTANSDVAEAITTDNAGYVYVTGYCDECGSNGNRAIYTYKMDPSDASVIWATTTDPTSGNDDPRGIVADEAGFLYVTSECDSCGADAFDAQYTFKIDSTDGSMLWGTTTDPSNNYDGTEGIVVDDKGGVYVTGFCNGCGAIGGYAYYTFKIDSSDGSMLWATTTDPTTGTDLTYGLAIDDAGNPYVTGVCNACGGQGGFAYYTAKVDPSDGSMLWATTTDPTSNSDYAYAIGSDGEYVYVSGRCSVLCGGDGEMMYSVKMDPDDGSMVAATTTGAVVNVGAKQTQGVIGQGLQFDGIDTHVRMEEKPFQGETEGTVCAWMYYEPESVSEDSSIVSGFELAQGGWLLFVDDSSLSGRLNTVSFTLNAGGGAGGRVDGSSDLVSFNEWQHYCGTFELSSFIRLYKNGELDQENTTSIVATVPNNFLGMAIGDDIDVRRGLDGRVDDVRIYNRALDATEIQRVYELGATTKIAKTLDSNPELEDGLIAHYTFDGDDIDTSSTTGEVIDKTGTNTRGDWIEHATTTIPGVLGQAIEFDGVDDQVDTLPLIANENNWTIATWVKASDLTLDNRTIYSEGANLSSNFLWLYVREDCCGEAFKVQLRVWDTAADSIDSVTALNEDTWYHIVVTHDNDDYVIFIDGEYDNADNFSRSPTVDRAAIGALRRGSNIDWWQGGIDDLRIYDRTLSTSTIKRLYELGATTKVNKTITTNPDLERGLAGHWTFDGRTGLDTSSSTAEVLDRSANGLHGDWQDHATSTAPGVIGQALTFDGVDDFVEIEDNAVFNFGTSPVSVSAWVRWDSNQLGSYNAIISQSLDNFEFNRDSTDALRLEMKYDDNSTMRSSSGASSITEADRWYHVVGVFYPSTGDSDFYVDGELRPTFFIDSQTGGTLKDSSLSVYLGARNSSELHTGGEIDDIRLYDRALSAEEVTRLYQLGQ